MRTIARRLVDGQDLLVEIKKILNEQDIEAGVILLAMGGLKQSTIRVPVIDGKVVYIHPQNLEIHLLQGTVSKHGCHLHIAVSDIEGKAWGGHLKEGCIVRGACQLLIGVLEDKVFKREPDPETGFDELVVLERTA
jgi:predicted DNA-binding protein with PD1-like motif